jgi:hypothetical protein
MLVLHNHTVQGVIWWLPTDSHALAFLGTSRVPLLGQGQQQLGFLTNPKSSDQYAFSGMHVTEIMNTGDRPHVV